MFKGQGQTTHLNPVCCPLNIFLSLHLINTKLGAELPLMSRWSLLIFRSHVQRSRSNHYSQPSVLSSQYLLTPLLHQYQNWCWGCSISRRSLLIFRSHDQRSRSNHSFEPIMLYSQYLLIPCLRTGFASTEKINLNFAPWVAYMFLEHFLFILCVRPLVHYQ